MLCPGRGSWQSGHSTLVRNSYQDNREEKTKIGGYGMFGMVFEFDEAKVETGGNYTVEQLHDKVDQVAEKYFLYKKEAGHYTNYMERYAYYLVLRTLQALREEPWFMDYVSELRIYGDDIDEEELARYRELSYAHYVEITRYEKGRAGE